MDSRVIEIRKHLKKKLDPMRFEHTLGVSYTCQALAMRYGYDLDKAELAGLLHDCAKRYDRPTMLEKCISRGIPVSESEERDPSLLHAKLIWPVFPLWRAFSVTWAPWTAPLIL